MQVNDTKFEIREKGKDEASALYLQQFLSTIFTGVTMDTDRLTKSNLALQTK